MADLERIDFTAALINNEKTNRLIVRLWLYIICLLVIAMVIVGGATRLTDSGLSITEWKPLLGLIPPLSEFDWISEFEKYKLIPQYSEINFGMSLEEFKFIYWWEWAHRFLGRFVGVVFIVPFVWLWASGRLEKGLKPRLLFLLFLGALQGVVGWWMVSSGLVERTDVSQYRLAVHLGLAAIIFAYGLWIARGLAFHSDDAAPFSVRLFAPILVLLVLLQILAGALVAGLDAGLAFNDWPLMDQAVIPGGLFVLDPVWQNFFENPKLVQFVHRVGAYFLLAMILINLMFARNATTGPTHRRRAYILVFLAFIQVALGVITLVLQVPLYWALAHQFVAFVLLALTVAHWRALRGSYAPVTAIEIRS